MSRCPKTARQRTGHPRGHGSVPQKPTNSRASAPVGHFFQADWYSSNPPCDRPGRLPIHRQEQPNPCSSLLLTDQSSPGWQRSVRNLVVGAKRTCALCDLLNTRSMNAILQGGFSNCAAGTYLTTVQLKRTLRLRATPFLPGESHSALSGFHAFSPNTPDGPLSDDQ